MEALTQTLTAAFGDRVWISPCGNAVLVNADCLEVFPLIPEGSVDAVVTDPPYGIVNKFGIQSGQTGKGSRRLQFDWDSQEVADTVRSALSGAFSACKKSAACIVYCGFDTAERFAEPAWRAGFTVKPLAWVKKCPPPAGFGNWWPSAFEIGYYGYRNSPWFGDTDPKRCNVWVFDSYRHGQPGKVDHPTQKPLGLIERQVQSVVPAGGVCIDCFAGSGTTGVACIKHGRKFIGIEIEPKHFATACNRIANEHERFALFNAAAQDTQRELFEEPDHASK